MRVKCLLLLLCIAGSLTVFSQDSNSRLIIYVSSKDSTFIRGAQVYLDGEALTKEKGQSEYVKENFAYSEEGEYLLYIKHKIYQSRTIIIKGTDLRVNNKTSKTTYYRKGHPVYLFRKSDHVLIHGRDSISFEFRPEFIRIFMCNKNKKDSAELLFEKLNLEIIQVDASPYLTLKKKDGGKFKTKNCKELKAIRESGFVKNAGPLFNKGIMTQYISIRCDEKDKEKVIRIMKSKGMSVEKYSEKPYTITFKADNGIGYDIAKVSVSLLKYPEIKYINTDIKEPNTIFE